MSAKIQRRNCYPKMRHTQVLFLKKTTCPLNFRTNLYTSNKIHTYVYGNDLYKPIYFFCAHRYVYIYMHIYIYIYLHIYSPLFFCKVKHVKPIERHQKLIVKNPHYPSPGRSHLGPWLGPLWNPVKLALGHHQYH